MDLLDLNRTESTVNRIQSQLLARLNITSLIFLYIQRLLKCSYLVVGFDANKGLSQRHRSEATVKEEETNKWVDM